MIRILTHIIQLTFEVNIAHGLIAVAKMLELERFKQNYKFSNF